MYARSSKSWVEHLDFIILDEVALQVAFILAYICRNGSGIPYELFGYRLLAIVYIVVDILAAVLFSFTHNVTKRGYYIEFVESIKHVFIVFGIISCLLFAIQIGSYYSRVIVFLTAAFHLVLGYATRMVWKHILWLERRKSAPKISMILVAGEQDVSRIVASERKKDAIPYAGLVLSDRDAVGETIEGLEVVANLGNAADYICREWVDEVFLCPSSLSALETPQSIADNLLDNVSMDDDMPELDSMGKESLKEGTEGYLISRCRQMDIPVHICLPFGSAGRTGFMEKVNGHNVLTIARRSVSLGQMIVKRMMDIVGGVIGSMVAIVVIAVVGPIIRHENPGPVLFKQERIGINGRRFVMYKIRSMYMDAEERKKELMQDNRVSDGMMFKVDWDPRILGNHIVDGERKTGIGEFIRRTSLDEFPQFFNVLRGEMSIVGTRPPTVDEWEKYQYHHRARLAMRPGITGLWQVSGRSEITDFEEVVALDAEYIQNWSIGLDIKIIMKTFKAVFTGRGAM